MSEEKFWKKKGFKPGRKRKFTPQKLWEAACGYFDWVEDNPILEEQIFAYKGDITYGKKEKMRAMSFRRMCAFIELDHSNYTRYRKDERYSAICETIDSIILDQKFEGAAAGLLNPTIISRDLGLRDNVDHTSNGETISGDTTVSIDNSTVLAKDVQDILDMI